MAIGSKVDIASIKIGGTAISPLVSASAAETGFCTLIATRRCR